jgi:hypothetical protein
MFAKAKPLTKLMIALGLNASSGAAELGRLKVTDFSFNSEHPKSKVIKFAGKQNWLITTRRKTYCHSERLLWSWVADLVKNQIAICKKNNWIYLFTEKGQPLYRDNEIYEELGLDLPNTTKPESRFVGRFQKANHTNLSFGKLRKTFPNWLRMENHGELATLALSHGTNEDKLLANYTNEPYARLFQATLEAESF